jgi:hypothetical protein
MGWTPEEGAGRFSAPRVAIEAPRVAIEAPRENEVPRPEEVAEDPRDDDKAGAPRME